MNVHVRIMPNNKDQAVTPHQAVASIVPLPNPDGLNHLKYGNYP